MDNIISEHILECYKYRADLNGTINKLLNYFPEENYESLKEKLSHYDINTVWCREFWNKYYDKINEVLNKNEGIMLFVDLMYEINFTYDLNTSVFNLNVPDDFEFRKDIIGVWISKK